MIKKILLFIVVFINFSCLLPLNNTFATDSYDKKVESSSTTNDKGNSHLDKLYKNVFVNTSNTGANGVKDIIIIIAKDIKNIFFAIAGIYFLIITIRLLFSSNSEEGFENYKKGLIWITIGIIVMQMSYAFVVNTFDKTAPELAGSLITSIIKPIIALLETFAAVFFLLVAVYSFIRLVSTNGDKEKAKKGIDAIIYATIGIFLVLISSTLLNNIYGTTDISVISGSSTFEKIDGFNNFAAKFMSFINWITGFVAIVTIIMIMYAGVNIIFAAGDEEKLKKGRTTIIYAFIGIFILVISYLILTFFIGPEGSKINAIL